MQTTEEINNEYLQAKEAEARFCRRMASAVFNAGSYISPTDADIAEAGPEWKPNRAYYDINPETSNPTKKAVDEFAGIMKNLGGEFAMAVAPNTGTPEDEKALIEFYSLGKRYDPKFFPDIEVEEYKVGQVDPVFGVMHEDGVIRAIPKMEVEELEVINIELSDYPLPENVTTYDWWWA